MVRWNAGTEHVTTQRQTLSPAAEDRASVALPSLGNISAVEIKKWSRCRFSVFRTTIS
jgi:hypothetical protein